ncbi:hypothetical protein [Pseudalkalibacillus decolorationis]|uniref:GntT/GntP/DsdX family permease n=1 Tax=Pseudalkalibacillus decolorationis TaxID=163879 RepID=UPI0027E2CAFF|nr:hypothetical protein [Pseudalkalibacillus decolorationis]
MSLPNDSGFWVLNRLGNLTIPQTMKTWTLGGFVTGLTALAVVYVCSCCHQYCQEYKKSGSARCIKVTLKMNIIKRYVFQKPWRSHNRGLLLWFGLGSPRWYIYTKGYR